MGLRLDHSAYSHQVTYTFLLHRSPTAPPIQFLLTRYVPKSTRLSTLASRRSLHSKIIMGVHSVVPWNRCLFSRRPWESFYNKFMISQGRRNWHQPILSTWCAWSKEIEGSVNMSRDSHEERDPPTLRQCKLTFPQTIYNMGPMLVNVVLHRRLRLYSRQIILSTRPADSHVLQITSFEDASRSPLISFACITISLKENTDVRGSHCSRIARTRSILTSLVSSPIQYRNSALRRWSLVF